MINYVFKQQRHTPYSVNPAIQFRRIDTPAGALRHARPLLRALGMVEYLKILLKSFTRNRVFYFLSDRDTLIAYGYLSIGFCHYYSVAYGDVVIGSIWTHPKRRGQGLATEGIRLAMNHMLNCGRDTFYIDTQATNFAMLRSIEKLEFGRPHAEFKS
ncbi:GNAT family N-acetyltransferase [Vibrio sp. CAU 1672]|uniref:GNAT family N-acetyltransferase n=1 Tax=Vibrio sp. CAU 1672 TaxID=3032594 RepID=UPI0023DC10A8|nr:GNAT family N-acetyltransferase [Vibrio sp. CAU 1672]MDF2154398.1 GNAT family N-acetyltransferase [Vibrio sp. CAU 1672]